MTVSEKYFFNILKKVGQKSTDLSFNNGSNQGCEVNDPMITGVVMVKTIKGNVQWRSVRVDHYIQK